MAGAGGMVPNVYDEVSMIAGVTWRWRLRYLTPPDVNGDQFSAIPAGWTVKAQFRAHHNASATLLLLEPTPDYDTGEILLVATPDETRALPSVGFYAVEIAAPDTDPEDAVELVRGRFSVEGAGVTP